MVGPFCHGVVYAVGDLLLSICAYFSTHNFGHEQEDFLDVDLCDDCHDGYRCFTFIIP